MNPVDIAIIVILVLQFALGIKNGAVYEILSMMLMILCLVAAYLITPVLANKVTGIFNVEGIDQYIKGAFFLCFLVLSVSALSVEKMIGLATKLLSRIASKTKISRIVGGILSLTRTGALCGALLIVFPMIKPSHEVSVMINESKMAFIPVTTFNKVYEIVENYINKENITLEDIKGLVK